MSTTTGSCACGEIKYEFVGEPINTAFCYCRDCQKHTNSDKWFGAWVPKDTFSFIQGTPNTYQRIGDSGKSVTHYFCGDCGTTLAGFVEVAQFYSVAATTIDNNDALKPNMLIYTAHAKDWAVFPDGVPKFDILPPNLG